MKKILIIVISSILLFTNCTDSFLDLSNPSTLSSSIYPQKMSDLESIVTSIYANLISVPLYGKRVMAKGSFCVDHTVDMGWIADQNWNQLTTNQISSDNTYVGTLWAGYYKVISCANTVLDDVEQMDKKKFTTSELSRISQIKGEALFWRAWAHQQLVCFFGEGYPCNGDGDKKGVPIRLNVASSPSELNIARSTVNDVYAQVEEDYLKAKELLPAKWSNRADFPRPTSVAVKSYLGQLYLYKGSYEKSKIELKDVIENSGKSLVNFDEYQKMFNEDQVAFNNESILELNLKNGSSASYWWYGEGSKHALLIALCYINTNGGVVSAGWGNEFFHDSNIERFGADPRLKITALEPGTPVVMNGNATVVAKYKDIEPKLKGWSIRKYNPLKSTIAELKYGVGINMYLMRLADVYLMYAEACQATNDDVNARKYLNLVRRRAYNVSDDSHDLASSSTVLRDNIRDERFLEFCAEGTQHWFDVCRWKTLDQEINKWYIITRVGSPHYDSMDLYFPIPKAELENNPLMKQSSGY